MKSRMLVSLLLALVMLAALATPALAGKPEKGFFHREIGEPSGWGKYSLQVTRLNQIKVTVVLKDATPLKQYRLILNYGVTPSLGNGKALDYITADDNGNIRYTTKTTIATSNKYVRLKFLHHPYLAINSSFYGDVEELTFKT